jgi:hypothetical protein
MVKVWFKDRDIFILTEKGEEGKMPLDWFPRLKSASQKELENFEISPMGIHWPVLDEDLSFEGFFNFKKDKLEAEKC